MQRYINSFFYLPLLAISSAVIMFCSYPGDIHSLGNPFAAMFALVPILLAVRSVTKIPHLILLALFFGMFSNILQFYWLAYFQLYAGWALISSAIGYAVYNIPLFILLFAASRLPQWIRPLALGIALAAYEYLKSIGVLGFPWGIIANAASSSLPMIQIVDIFGVWGLSFLLSYANAVILECILCKQAILPWRNFSWKKQHLLCFLCLLAIVYGYGIVRLTDRYELQTEMAAVMVQNNSDPWQDDQAEESLIRNQQLSDQGLEELRQLGRKADIIIWSETALRYDYVENKLLYKFFPSDYPFRDFLRKGNTPLLTGSPLFIQQERENNEVEELATNSAILLSPEGELLASYAKQHLVPFAEHIPDWNNESIRNFYTSAINIQSTWVGGQGPSLLPLTLQNGKEVKIGTLICFEDAFGYLGRQFWQAGADILVTISNNSWSGRYATLAQHLATARFRSVETRKTLIRVGNNGITSIIDARGVIRQSIPPLQQSVMLTPDIAIYKHYSGLYMLWGDYLGYILVMLSFSIGYMYKRKLSIHLLLD